MKLQYKKVLRCLIPNGCEHIKNGVIRRDHLMRTDFIPQNFRGTVKKFVLRHGHDQWVSMHKTAEEEIQKEWLVELGYDPEGYEVSFDNLEIKAKDNPHWNPDYHKSTGAVEKDREVDSI